MWTSFGRPCLTSKRTSILRYCSQYSFYSPKQKATVLGIYQSPNSDQFCLTPRAQDYVSKHGSSIVERIQSSGPLLKEGTSRILSSLKDEDHYIVIAGLGSKDFAIETSDAENRDLQRETIRTAISSAVRSLIGHKSVTNVSVDDCGDSESCSEGAHLALWAYDQLKAEKNSLAKIELSQLNENIAAKDWLVGKRKALGQNLARTLMEAPANVLTPTQFAKIASNELSPFGVEVIARDLKWIQDQKMGSFLSVTRGSNEAPVFLEMIYSPSNAPDTKPVALVGKGITFDTGGISIKPASKMEDMRADMGGAANVVGALQTIASLGVPISIRAVTPLCENMPGGRATKPGDVVTAMNGKTIQVDNTDAEGRLVLADALCYVQKYDPRILVDLATLTGAISVALGPATCGVFTNSNKYWPVLEDAAFHAGDRVWRMPLWKYYSDQIKRSRLADLNNISGKPQGGSCTAAAFLKEFVTCENWFHFDIAGVADNTDEVPYLPRGMSGRPCRTLAEFLRRVHAQDL